MADYNFLLETRLSQDQQMVLQAVERVCRAAGLNLYLTGGAMRALLSGAPVRALQITTEGDPVKIAPDLQAVGAERLSRQPGQPALRLNLRGVRVRIRAAQTATGTGTVIEDLRRRGLTLNSIGLSLNPGSRGLPLDPTNGAADIEARLIRMNDAYVFLETPIVLLRAVRLQTRLGFAIEERTLARMAAAREGRYLERATPAERGQELEAIAYQPDPAAVLKALEAEHWLEPAFGKGMQTSKINLAALARLGAVAESWEQLGLIPDVGLVAMPLLLGRLSGADQTRLAQWLPSRHLAEWRKLLNETRGFETRLLGVSGTGWLRRTQELIEKHSAEAVVYASLEPHGAKVGKKLREFQAAALQLRQRLPMHILRGVGVAPGSMRAEALVRPLYGRLLGGEVLGDAELGEALRTVAAAAQPSEPAAARVARAHAGRKLESPPRAGNGTPAPKPAVRPSPPSGKNRARPAASPSQPRRTAPASARKKR